MTRSTRMPHAFSWLAALLVIVAVTVGCGRGNPVKRLQASQQATLDAGSATFVIEQSFEGGPVAGQKITTEGVLDFKRRAGRATLKLADGEAEVVFAGDTTYFRLPPSQQVQKPWIRIDRQDVEQFSGLKNVSSDPSRNLDLLDGIAGEVEEVGEEDVRGARTTHYRFTIDLQQAVKTAPADRREAVQQQAAILGVDQLPMELWLDAKGRIARQAFAINLQNIQLPTGTPPSGNLSGTARTLIEYSNFGIKVDAPPPPEDQVTDFGSLQGG